MRRLLMPDTYFTIKYGDRGRLQVHERDYIQRIIMSSGYYEPEVWNILAECAVSGEVLWDIGANIGSISVLAQQDSKFAQIHAFEPQSRVISRLKANININSNSNVTIHEYAIGNRVGNMKIYLSNIENSGTTSFERRAEDHLDIVTNSVDCLTIDEVIARKLAPLPTMMKIDVEGWELHVIKGGAKLLMAAPPRVIIFESPFDHANQMPTNDEIVQLLKTYGYSIRHIRRLNGSLFTYAENFVAIFNDFSNCGKGSN